jgi:hypothetical protein
MVIRLRRISLRNLRSSMLFVIQKGDLFTWKIFHVNHTDIVTLSRQIKVDPGGELREGGKYQWAIRGRSKEV